MNIWVVILTLRWSNLSGTKDERKIISACATEEMATAEAAALMHQYRSYYDDERILSSAPIGGQLINYLYENKQYELLLKVWNDKKNNLCEIIKTKFNHPMNNS